MRAAALRELEKLKVRVRLELSLLNVFYIFLPFFFFSKPAGQGGDPRNFKVPLGNPPSTARGAQIRPRGRHHGCGF